MSFKNAIGFFVKSGGVVLDPDYLNLITRIETAGENPTPAWRSAMNTAIIASKEAGVYNTLFDCLYILRGFGDASTKMNIIKNSHNAQGVNNPTRTNDVGYNSNGNTSCLNLNYKPFSDNSLMQTNDIGLWYKSQGVLSSTTAYHGSGDGGGINGIADGTNAQRLNGALTNNANVIGWNALYRNTSFDINIFRNELKYKINASSTGRTDRPLTALAFNVNNTILFYFKNTEKLELIGISKSFNENQYNDFKTIWNNFFNTYQ